MAEASPDDPFGALGLERRFDLDPAVLRRAWLAASADRHPDRAGGDPLEEAEIARRSAALNHAKRTLEDPERRADALLILMGGPAKDADRSLPDGFLESMMEVREELEAAAGDPGRVGELERWAQSQRRERLGRVRERFERCGDDPTAESLGEIRTELNALRYIERMLEQIHPGPGSESR